jgi:hypothetical protein
MNKRHSSFIAGSIQRVFHHPLVLLIFTTFALLTLLYAIHQENISRLDKYILGFVCLVFSLSALFMVVHTHWNRWTILGSGLFAAFLADAMLYGRLTYSMFSNDSDYPLAEFTLVLTRVLFVTAGTWILCGLVFEAVASDIPEKTKQRWRSRFNTLLIRLHIRKGYSDGSNSSFDHSDNQS